MEKTLKGGKERGERYFMRNYIKKIISNIFIGVKYLKKKEKRFDNPFLWFLELKLPLRNVNPSKEDGLQLNNHTG